MEGIVMEQVINLEHKIAEISFMIANEEIIDKNIVDKALGVLVNDGIYAMWLFIEEKKSKANPEEFCKKIEELLKEARLVDSCNCSTVESRGKFFKQLTEDLNKLILARQILEKLFIYVRHQYKALGED